MQIYGILLNIRGILLNIRGILLKNRENQRNLSVFIPFLSTSFLFIPQTLDFLPQMLNLTGYNKKVIFLFGRT